LPTGQNEWFFANDEEIFDYCDSVSQTNEFTGKKAAFTII
jgi:hypothetical protein